MHITDLHHAQITIPPGAEAEARAFYCGLLGLTEIAKPISLAGRGGLWLQVGERQVHIGVEEDVERRATKAHLAYAVEDLPAWRARLTSAGVTLSDPPPIPGYRRFEFRDPFGNRVEFIERFALRLGLTRRRGGLWLTEEEFEALVIEAVEGLPPFFRDRMRNVEVLTQAWPTPYDLASADVEPGHTLLGLYTGIPLTERTGGYNLVSPDTITLFQGPIENEAGPDREAIRRLVRHVTIHEFAHHFGISDDRLRELGAY